MLSPAGREEERRAQQRRRQYRRDQERKEAARRSPPQAVRRPYGCDHLWRAYVDSSLPWVEEQPGGIVLVDVEGAAVQGVQIVDMGNGIIRMEE